MSRFLFFLFYTASQGDQNKSALCINYHIKFKVLFTSKKPKFMIFDMLPERVIIPYCDTIDSTTRVEIPYLNKIQIGNYRQTSTFSPSD